MTRPPNLRRNLPKNPLLLTHLWMIHLRRQQKRTAKKTITSPPTKMTMITT